MLYLYCHSDGLDIVESARIRLSTLKKINDPFELRIGIDEERALITVRNEHRKNHEILAQLERALIGHEIPYTKGSVDDILDKFTKLRISSHKEQLAKIWQTYCDKVGIICTSESMDIIQMWSHYADRHKGVVIGIEEEEFIESPEQLMTVCYRDKMPLLPVMLDQEKFLEYANKHILDSLARKQSNWSYEKEVRLYVGLNEESTDGYYYKDIPSTAIREIYLGLEASDDAIQRVKNISQRCEYKDLKIYRMERHPSAYKLIAKKW